MQHIHQNSVLLDDNLANIDYLGLVNLGNKLTNASIASLLLSKKNQLVSDENMFLIRRSLDHFKNFFEADDVT